jgi:hypothetical protein
MNLIKDSQQLGHTTDFRSADSSTMLLISTTMYGSAHTTTIRNRPTNKFQESRIGELSVDC